MAIIQNQAIIQKLVDELELYPALDKIPTELAEKIIPTFQVNPEQNVVLKESWESKYFFSTANIYTITVPDNKTWTIKSMFAEYNCVAVVDNRFFECIIKNAANETIAQFSHDTAMTTGQTWGYNFIEGTDVNGTTNNSVFFRTMAFIKDLKLPEKCTIKFWDYGNQQPTDSIKMTLIVNEQDA